MTTKNFPVSGFKVIDSAQGIVEFIVSVFNTPDRTNDVMQPGSFAKAIASQKRLPKFVPDHNWSVPMRLGKVLEWSEVPIGTRVQAQYNLEKQIARDLYSDMIFDPDGQEFSFSFDIAPNGSEVKDGVRYIKELSEVFDVGPVGVGMHRDTGLLSVKSFEEMLAEVSAELKYGATHSRVTREWLTTHKETFASIRKAATDAEKDIEARLAKDEDDGKSATLGIVDTELTNQLLTTILVNDARLSGIGRYGVQL